jgi:hypothetical protein
MVNTVYWATDDPERPKSHDRGIPLRTGDGVRGDLLIIPGPLAINWKERVRSVVPRLETGELAGYSRPSLHRAGLWLSHAPRIGEDVFIKLYAHGAPEKNAAPMLGTDLDRTFACLNQVCAEKAVDLHFVTAWQMFEAIDALRERRDPIVAVKHSRRRSLSVGGTGR